MPDLHPVCPLLGAFLCGCAGIAQTPASQLPSQTRPPLARRLEHVATTIASKLPRGGTLRLEPPEGLNPYASARIQRTLTAAIERCAPSVLVVSPEESPGEVDDLITGESAFRAAGRAVVTDGGWLLSWRLVHGGRVLARASTHVWRSELRAPLPKTPLGLTQRILSATRLGEGEVIVDVLHPELLRVWRRRAAHRGQGLDAFALAQCQGLLDLGAVIKWETRVGTTRAEVEAHYRGKFRDVDFRYRRVHGRWLLTKIDDYP